MRSSQYIPFFLPFSLAWPFQKHQGYGTSSSQLHKNLQDAWYTEYSKDSENEVTTLPAKKGPAAPHDPANVYSCAGPKAKDFPGKDDWLTFDQIWEINEAVIETANGGNDYNDYLQTAIKEVAFDSKVDARLILAIIMQESSGNVSIHCTEGTACGLMQHRGSARFDPSSPRTSIKAMIEDGTYGTPSVPGFLSYFNCDASSPSELTWINTQLINGNPYAAAYVYNTGHIDNEDLSTDRGKSNYYAHDVLSRLQGWNGWKAGCEQSRKCNGLGFQERSCW
ncbi:uncharacterized protein N0V89_001984 [Didymosphaeria variabile]|uniref:Transglycosylase SLT domain-containing protein n=1 Tax=Didymosphaeria variabile TaxID=1932322 RepID=A0A9W8XRU8_9PLEO|nr:uncharacterized protein N0V89_001984 [Didymosphaeria variabile]KAJ4357409.1 hypothetical protein N0V89_001984 [Didymosphaeria variabile]